MRNIIVLLFLAFASGVFGSGRGRNFYKILGIARNAKDPEIKKAYRQLSRKWHPDQNPDNKDEATAKFYDISEAYETLIDPEKRSKYDLGGEEALSGDAGPGGPGGFHRGDPYEQFRTFFQFFGDAGVPGGGGFPGAGFHGGGFSGGGHGGVHHEPARNLYDENSGVTEIGNGNEWNTHVEQRTELVVVDFYSPNCKPCITLKDQYISVAKTFSGIVRVMAVNCQSMGGQQLCQQQRVQNYPTIRMYIDSRRVVEFPSNQEKTSKSMGNWISSNIPDLTTRIDSGKKLTEFLSAADSKAPVLLFSDKKQVPALYKSLCQSFKANVACGVLLNFKVGSSSAVPEVLASQVHKTPSLYYIHDGISIDGEFFKGSMSSEILSLFFSRIVSHRSRRVFVVQLTANRSEDCTPRDATTCVLLLRDPKSCDEDANTYGILRQLAEKYKSDPIKFFWVNPGSKFVSMFSEVGSSGIVAYRGKRGRYSAYDGQANEESLNSWIDGIVTGGSALKLSVSKKALHDEL